MKSKQSHKRAVESFIQNLKKADPEKYKIIQKLRKAVHEIHPKATERIIYGGIMFSLKDDFGGIFPYTKHVSFEFGNGYKMKDAQKILEGNGKYRRHIKITSLAHLQEIDVKSYIKQAA